MATRRLTDFTLPADDGGTVSLKALNGKPVVLYFYPKDDTSGCTAEACAFRDALPDFSKVEGRDRGRVARFGRKPRPVQAEIRAALPAGLGRGRQGLPGLWRVGREEHVWQKIKYMGIERSTFLIDANGVVRKMGGR